MARTLNEFESQIQPLVRDTAGGIVTTDVIKDSLNRGIKFLIKDHGVYATKKPSSLDLFDSVEEYPVPSDFFDVISLQRTDAPRNFLKTQPDAFYRTSGDILSVDSYKNDHCLLVKATNIAASTVINSCESTTDNGTWAAEGSTDAANVSSDTVNEKVGSGAISFDVTVGASVNNYAAIQNSTMTQVDLTDFVSRGTVFCWVYIPSITNLTSFTLRWGNDSSNYYSNTVTTQYSGYGFRVGWNRLGFSWPSATETGTVTDTAIDYLNFRVTYSASYTSQVGFLLDDVRVCNPYRMDLMYYSTHFVVDSSGNTQALFSTSSDASLLDDADDDALFFHALADGYWITREYNDRIEALKERDKAIERIKTRLGSEKKREVMFYR